MEESEKDLKPNEMYFDQKRKYLIANEDNSKKTSFSESISGNNMEKTSKSRGVCLPAAIADGLARHHAQEQLVYKHKLKRLKKMIRDIVLENGALCDTVAGVQDELALAIEERQYLLRKVMQIQLSTEQHLQYDIKPFQDYDEDGEKPVVRKCSEEKVPLGGQASKALLARRRQAPSNEDEKAEGAGRSSKAKCRKGGKAKRKCPPIPLDSAGRPIFPLNLGRLTIHSLGDIVGAKDGYHTSSMIFPVGFCSSRTYASLANPHQRALYTCTIKEGGANPRFDIVCDEDDAAFYGASPTECHSQILKKINMILGLDLLPTSLDTTEAEQRGLRFFGLSHPSVQNMIQACPGARKCPRYKWIQFEVCKSEAEAEGVLEPDREASICHETLLRNIRFASNHM